MGFMRWLARVRFGWRSGMRARLRSRRRMAQGMEVGQGREVPASLSVGDVGAAAVDSQLAVGVALEEIGEGRRAVGLARLLLGAVER